MVVFIKACDDRCDHMMGFRGLPTSASRVCQCFHNWLQCCDEMCCRNLKHDILMLTVSMSCKLYKMVLLNSWFWFVDICFSVLYFYFSAFSVLVYFLPIYTDIWAVRILIAVWLSSSGNLSHDMPKHNSQLSSSEEKLSFFGFGCQCTAFILTEEERWEITFDPCITSGPH